MPRYSLFFCACLITGVLAQGKGGGGGGGGGGLGSDVRMVIHTDSNIRYSSVATGLGHADCTRVPTPCASKWWSEANEGGTASLVSTRHATTGPGSSLSFAFSGSRQLIVGGKRDSSVSATVSLNGAPFSLSGDTDSLIFSTTNLNPSTTYNVVLNYGGHGTLGFAGFAVDKSARISQGQALPAPPDSGTHLPGPTLQPAPSNPAEPTKTPPENPKPTDSTLPPGGGSTSTSSKPKPSTDPAEGAQQPSDSPGGNNDASPSSTGTAPTASDTASPPDNGNSNAVTPHSGDGDETAGSGSGGNQPGNAGAGSPQSGSSKKNTGAIVGGVIGALLALILLGAAAVWYARRRVLARRAPSYAFRHGPGEFASPPPHWTQRPSSPQPEMVEKPLQ